MAPTLGRFIDIISSKQWANGPKDHEALPELWASPEFQHSERPDQPE